MDRELSLLGINMFLVNSFSLASKSGETLDIVNDSESLY